MVECVTIFRLYSKKRVTHSTIKVLHHSTSSECVTTFPCSLSRAYPNEHKVPSEKLVRSAKKPVDQKWWKPVTPQLWTRVVSQSRAAHMSAVVQATHVS